MMRIIVIAVIWLRNRLLSLVPEYLHKWDCCLGPTPLSDWKGSQSHVSRSRATKTIRPCWAFKRITLFLRFMTDTLLSSAPGDIPSPFPGSGWVVGWVDGWMVGMEWHCLIYYYYYYYRNSVFVFRVYENVDEKRETKSQQGNAKSRRGLTFCCPFYCPAPFKSSPSLLRTLARNLFYILNSQ